MSKASQWFDPCPDPSPFYVEREVWGPSSQAPAPVSCATVAGWERNNEKSPLKDRQSISSGLPRWGQPLRAGEGALGQLLQAVSLPHSFPRRRSWEVWRRLATFGVSYFW